MVWQNRCHYAGWNSVVESGGYVKAFQTTKQNVSLHINNIFKDGELDSASVVKECLTTGADGKTIKQNFIILMLSFPLAIVSNPQRGVQFRIWATNILKEYIKRFRDGWWPPERAGWRIF